ncbi:MFS transporter [Wenxinia saemankumensis]|uniref:Predicted arabinose efflux permease, MFS family n=1 Tax=Wenxinia saemankumensis TaxID=1447782 RepID=A0A1M6E1H9_9RHOB|nr:MFS transporter [Wenxinia saemankumensis]SHI79362.1 Predicted arabinose efflux permease, MFS family [Wenxinia saemankumensis]
MRVGLAVLVVAYALSQFYRAFLAVLAPTLIAEIGATPEGLATASGLWFLVFALMQIPVGWALDRLGPRRTAAWLLALGGGGGAAVFALAQGPGAVTWGMVLLGIGCSPVLMASYYIFARIYPPRVFATLAGAVIGLGSLGNVAAAAPMAWAATAFGWRETLVALAVLSLAVAALIALTVRDPERAAGGTAGGLSDLLRIPALWPVLALAAVNYAPAASLRGLWAGPYAGQVFGADAGTIGTVTLAMGLAMIAGNFAYGPLDRLLGTRKWVIFGGNAICAGACLALALAPASGLWAATALLMVVGAAGASYPAIVAHARAFAPAHLAGRGVTLANLFSIGGVGIMQLATGPVFEGGAGQGADPVEGFRRLFVFYAALLAVGLVAYLFSRDRLD